MSTKHYDIKNISSGRWKDTIDLHLSAGPYGYETVSLAPSKTLEGVREDQLSQQIKLLAKKKRERPPVITIEEIDIELRKDELANELELKRLRKEKQRARAAQVEVPPQEKVEEPVEEFDEPDIDEEELAD